MLTSRKIDFFNWNFILIFVAVTAVIVVGSVLPSVKVTALGLPIIVVGVSAQLLWQQSL